LYTIDGSFYTVRRRKQTNETKKKEGKTRQKGKKKKEWGRGERISEGLGQRIVGAEDYGKTSY